MYTSKCCSAIPLGTTMGKVRYSAQPAGNPSHLPPRKTAALRRCLVNAGTQQRSPPAHMEGTGRKRLLISADRWNIRLMEEEESVCSRPSVEPAWKPSHFITFKGVCKEGKARFLESFLCDVKSMRPSFFCLIRPCNFSALHVIIENGVLNASPVRSYAPCLNL